MFTYIFIFIHIYESCTEPEPLDEWTLAPPSSVRIAAQKPSSCDPQPLHLNMRHVGFDLYKCPFVLQQGKLTIDSRTLSDPETLTQKPRPLQGLLEIKDTHCRRLLQ